MSIQNQLMECRNSDGFDCAHRTKESFLHSQIGHFIGFASLILGTPPMDITTDIKQV
jgi:hypothetical protein